MAICLDTREVLVLGCCLEVDIAMDTVITWADGHVTRLSDVRSDGTRDTLEQSLNAWDAFVGTVPAWMPCRHYGFLGPNLNCCDRCHLPLSAHDYIHYA